MGPGLFFSFVLFFTQTVGLLGRVISPSQGRCLHAGQHKHTIPAFEVEKTVHALDRAATVISQLMCMLGLMPGYCDGTINLGLNLDNVSRKGQMNLPHYLCDGHISDLAMYNYFRREIRKSRKDS
jgi:hypothetical protein